MPFFQRFLLLFCSFLCLNVSGQSFDSFNIKNLETENTYSIELKSGIKAGNLFGIRDVSINGEVQKVNFSGGKGKFTLAEESQFLFINIENNSQETLRRFYRVKKGQTQNIPLWWSILPPLLAIFMALLVKEVIISLFSGIFLGALMLNGFSFSGLVAAFFNVADKYVLSALTDSDHVSVILFSMLIGGMVAVISRNGGMAGVVNSLSGFANSAKNAQIITWVMGIAIFFDDYANTLIVGNTLRPVTDKFRVSREKLAYIVDSTAAPVAAVAFVTTWIGAELGYISDAVAAINKDGAGQITEGAYSLFLNSLAYSFYPILTLGFILMLILMNKDFGAMHDAESRARLTGRLFRVAAENEEEEESDMEDLQPIKGVEQRWFNAVIPVLVVVFGTLIGLVFTGYSSETWSDTNLSFFTKLSQTIGNSNSYEALIWSSLLAVVTALVMTIGQGIMSIEKTIETMIAGFKSMMPAMLVLILAWSLAHITKDLHTADFLSSIAEGNISPNFMPMITFILAAIIAFSTGSSWGTMAILYPLILPATWSVSMAAGMPTESIMPIFYNVISCVLAGSVLGDHCSPISDTTILSSLASNCNHIDHVRTQFPYAITVGLVSIFLSVFSVFVGLPAIVNFGIGFGILFAVVRFLGKEVPQAEH